MASDLIQHDLLSDGPPSTGLVVHTSEPTPLALIAKMVEAGQLTSESVSVVKELVALKEHMEDRQAEMDFASNFAGLQAELGSFKATKAVPDKQGNTKYCYLPYEEIMASVKPLLRQFGFSVSFSTDFNEGRILQTCTLQHVSGYSREFKAYVRVGGGPPGATESQADGSAMTYAKRYALCNALNITVEHDTDARDEGSPITQEQVDTLCQMVVDSHSDEKAFLKYAGAASYKEIGSRRYDDLFSMLKRKMARQ
jgi:hypothetical protein